MAFLHLYVDKVENIYVETPKVFKNIGNKTKNTVQKLKNALYGLSHIPRDLWTYMTFKLKNCGLVQSKWYH